MSTDHYVVFSTPLVVHGNLPMLHFILVLLGHTHNVSTDWSLNYCLTALSAISVAAASLFGLFLLIES